MNCNFFREIDLPFFNQHIDVFFDHHSLGNYFKMPKFVTRKPEFRG
jgi:hypothetical protein